MGKSISHKIAAKTKIKSKVSNDERLNKLMKPKAASMQIKKNPVKSEEK